jgi:fructose-bisphosphate aldolase class 1
MQAEFVDNHRKVANERRIRTVPAIRSKSSSDTVPATVIGVKLLSGGTGNNSASARVADPD